MGGKLVFPVRICQIKNNNNNETVVDDVNKKLFEAKREGCLKILQEKIPRDGQIDREVSALHDFYNSSRA